MNCTRILVGSVASLLLTAGFARAATVTLTMQNGNDGGGPFNTTAFEVSNQGPAGVILNSLSFTIGDTQCLFDSLYLAEEQFINGDGTQIATLTNGDRVNDQAGPDFFSYDFTNFFPGVAFRGQWDIDNDSGDFNADMRQVFFNNGAAPNAVATFNFADGSTINYTFPDLPLLDVYTLVIPEPSAAVTALVLGVMAMRRRP